MVINIKAERYFLKFASEYHRQIMQIHLQFDNVGLLFFFPCAPIHSSYSFQTLAEDMPVQHWVVSRFGDVIDCIGLCLERCFPNSYKAVGSSVCVSAT